jgi:uncharacterized protein VirK/YbjX
VEKVRTEQTKENTAPNCISGTAKTEDSVSVSMQMNYEVSKKAAAAVSIIMQQQCNVAHLSYNLLSGFRQ